MAIFVLVCSVHAPPPLVSTLYAVAARRRCPTSPAPPGGSVPCLDTSWVRSYAPPMPPPGDRGRGRCPSPSPPRWTGTGGSRAKWNQKRRGRRRCRRRPQSSADCCTRFVSPEARVRLEHWTSSFFEAEFAVFKVTRIKNLQTTMCNARRCSTTKRRASTKCVSSPLAATPPSPRPAP
jgi:hypothetical protein